MVMVMMTLVVRIVPDGAQRVPSDHVQGGRTGRRFRRFAAELGIVLHPSFNGAVHVELDALRSVDNKPVPSP